MIRTALLAAAIAALASSPASADYDFSWGSGGVDKELADRMAAARAAIADLGGSRTLRERRELVRRAYDRLARVLQRRPDHPEANYIAGELIYYWELFDYGHRARWFKRGIDHYTRYLASKPADTRTRGVLFRRSILYSKRALGLADYAPDFRRAIADYDRQLAILDSETNDSATNGNLATTLSNAAELHMGVGQLDRAIDLYVQSIATEPEALYLFGLAVALDRDGQRLRAFEVMRQAIETDKPNHEGDCNLNRDGVFFVPDGDKSYYLALRAEVLGKYAEARRHYQVFLNRLGGGRYADLARAHLADLRGKRDTWKPEAKECR